MGQFVFCSCWVIALNSFLENGAGHHHNRGGYLLFSAIYNALLHASEYSLANKIEECIPFALIHERSYLAESDDEREYKSSAAKTFDLSCCGAGYSASLSAITVSVSATSDVVCC